MANSEILRDTYQCVSDETLNNVFRRMGYHEKEFDGLRKRRNDTINKAMREAPGVKIRGVNIPMSYPICVTLIPQLLWPSSSPSVVPQTSSSTRFLACSSLFAFGAEAWKPTDSICLIYLILPRKRRSTHQKISSSFLSAAMADLSRGR